MCIFHMQIKVSKLHFNQSQKLILTRNSRPVKAAVGFEHLCVYKIRSNSNKISDRDRILNERDFNFLWLPNNGAYKKKLPVNLENLLIIFPQLL